jgi:hypothetical protein
MVDVPCRQVRMQGNLVLPGQADVENLGLGMVDSNDRMKVRRHVLSFRNGDPMISYWRVPMSFNPATARNDLHGNN